MKKSIASFCLATLLALTALLSASCQTDKRTGQLLQQADSLIKIRPDSMRTVLQAWADSMSREPEQVRMRYRLLCVKADDKAYVPHTSDSLILPLVRYYRSRRDKSLLPEALYYAGRTYSDLKDAPLALEYYQQAIDVMTQEKLTDYDLMSRIYSQMGELFIYQRLYKEAPGVIRKAYECDLILKDSASLVFDLRDIGRVFAITDQPDSAVWYYEKAGEMARHIKDSVLLSMVYGEMAGSYVKWGNYPAAHEKLQIAWQRVDTLSMPMYYNNTAKYYYCTGQLDSAAFYYKKKITVNSYSHKANGYSGLAKIAKEKGRIAEALNYYELFMLYDDSLKLSRQTEEINRINALYNYEKYRHENKKLKFESLRHKAMISFLILFVLLLSLLFAVLWQKHKRKEQSILLQQERLRHQQEKLKQNSQEQIEKNKKQIEILSQQLRQAEADKDLLRQNLLLAQREVAEKENLRIQAIQEMQQKAKDSLYKKEAYKKFHAVANNAKSPQSITAMDWQELQSIVDETYANFTDRLKELYPQISEKELQVCLLIKIGITPVQMASVLLTSKQNISSLRARLYTKLSGGKGSSKECDSLILNL